MSKPGLGELSFRYNLRKRKRKRPFNAEDSHPKRRSIQGDASSSTPLFSQSHYDDDDDDDNFSKLPDHFIARHILPRLDLKQRVRTSVLSRRWEHLWRCSLGTHLVVPNDSVPMQLFSRPWPFRFQSERFSESYVHEVDFFIKSFTGPQLDYFSVRFDVLPSSQRQRVIPRWLKFAFRWKVKRLDLYLAPHRHSLMTIWCMPSISRLSKFPCPKILLRGCGGISYLRQLSLAFVNIRGEAVEYLLSACPFLELLVLMASLSSNLKICGPSLKLKHLAIWKCLLPLTIEISAPCLDTLKFDGLEAVLLSNNAPLLANLYMSGAYFDQFVNEFARRPFQHFNYFFQLKRLKFDMSLEATIESINFPLELPNLVSLEELDLAVQPPMNVQILWPIVFLKAAPRLQRFSVQQLISTIYGTSATAVQMQKMRGATEFMHSGLKVFELKGFDGSAVVCEMVERVLSVAAVCLEKFVLEVDTGFTWLCREAFPVRMGDNIDTSSRPEMEKSMIRKLESMLPANAKLVVL